MQDFLAEFNLMNRLRDIYVSFALMLHDFGDCEAADNRIVYDPAGQPMPLFRTSEFRRGRDIVEAVENDPVFLETMRRAGESWQRLARPRSPQALSDPAASWGGRRFVGLRGI